MAIEIFTGVLYLLDIIFSFLLSYNMIKTLYIDKKLSKKKDFHIYNDYFSWEGFFLFVGIGIILKTINLFVTLTTEIQIIFFEIRIILVFMGYFHKIVHLEKVMNIITYERHYFAGIIPMIIAIILIIIKVSISNLSIIFIAISLVPYILMVIFKGNGSFSNIKKIYICLGAIIIGIASLSGPELFGEFQYIEIISAITYLIGIILIFKSIKIKNLSNEIECQN